MALSRVVSEVLNVEKYRDFEIPVRGQSRSLNVIPFDRLIVSYQCSMVTLSVRRTVFFEVFDFKNAVTLKPGLGVRRGH